RVGTHNRDSACAPVKRNRRGHHVACTHPPLFVPSPPLAHVRSARTAHEVERGTALALAPPTVPNCERRDARLAVSRRPEARYRRRRRGRKKGSPTSLSSLSFPLCSLSDH